MADEKRLYELLSRMLRYPEEGLADTARRCKELMAGAHDEAAEGMEGFARLVESTPRDRLRELYTSTFDLEPRCYPYLGYQLFGEHPKRGLLMVKLMESYREHGFQPGDELPDHVALLFQFLASVEDEELEEDLKGYLLSPALAKMARSLEESSNGYASLLRSAQLLCGEPAVFDIPTDTSFRCPGLPPGLEGGVSPSICSPAFLGNAGPNPFPMEGGGTSV